MNWKILLCLAFANLMFAYPREIVNLKKLIEIIQRRLLQKSRGLRESESPEVELSTPSDSIEEPQNLPRDDPTPPGHTLIKPASDMLASSAKYPHRDVSGSLVYGNLDNLGITYGKTRNRVLYSGFRRNNNMLENLLESVKSKLRYGHNKKYPVIIILKKNPSRVKNFVNFADDDWQYPSRESEEYPLARGDDSLEAENDAREISVMDQESSDDDDNSIYIRRSGKKHRSRKPYYASEVDSNTRDVESEDDDSSSDSSDYEKNPGNPYTVHKNRYKQNWLWNFAMTGDHMNINPKAPQFNSLGPTGADLFYGRKWWYFNQDDYVPFR